MDGLVDPASGHAVGICAITPVEVTAALARRGRAGHIPSSDLAATMHALSLDAAGRFEGVAASATVLDRAALLAAEHALRG